MSHLHLFEFCYNYFSLTNVSVNSCICCVCSQIMLRCTLSTCRINSCRITHTLLCPEGNRWPSLTWPGNSSDTSTPHTTTPAMHGTHVKHQDSLNECVHKSRQYSLPVLCVYCSFFTYGDLPLEQHLQQIEEEALSKFERTEPNTAVPPQKLWDKPVRYKIHTWESPVKWTHSIQVREVCSLFNVFAQRADQVTCRPDELVPDPMKQNTLCMSYLLGEWVDEYSVSFSFHF